MTAETILITGACGQLGSELTESLQKIYPRVIATDIKLPTHPWHQTEFYKLDVLHKPSLARIIQEKGVTQIYHLAAILSATGELQPELAWRINMKGLRNVLDVAASLNVKKVFFPSTIAVFGTSTPKINTPQFTAMEPNTIYGISKQAGEQWCHWYFRNKGLDVRSLRYPGLISYKTPAGGGTTDYAVEMLYAAANHGEYKCFLSENTRLPMMYMPDAIRGTVELMDAPAEKITVRTAYNFAGFSFAPKDMAAAIHSRVPNFKVTFEPDFRQSIADTWPQSIDDSYAQRDWNWKPHYDLEKTVADMLLKLSLTPVK
jgi:nucleoside-diphosphate-sugar epimerase